MQSDYSHLYRELGVTPDCSLEAFRTAYRRYVAIRHPDRGNASKSSDLNSLPLSEVTVLHELAVRFHVRHGRLPGAPGAWQRQEDTGARMRDGDDRGEGDQRVPARDMDEPNTAGAVIPNAASRDGRWRIALLLAAVAAAALVLVLSRPSVEPAATPATPTRVVKAQVATALPDQLELGMDRTTVLGIQGEPVRRRGRDWDYGPSWLRFDERDKLMDWYSSPLRRLKTAGDSPFDEAASDPTP